MCSCHQQRAVTEIEQCYLLILHILENNTCPRTEPSGTQAVTYFCPIGRYRLTLCRLEIYYLIQFCVSCEMIP